MARFQGREWKLYSHNFGTRYKASSVVINLWRQRQHMSLFESQQIKQRTKLVISGKSEVVVFVECFCLSSKWHVAKTVNYRYGGNIDFLLGKVAHRSIWICLQRTSNRSVLQRWINLYTMMQTYRVHNKWAKLVWYHNVKLMCSGVFKVSSGGLWGCVWVWVIVNVMDPDTKIDIGHW